MFRPSTFFSLASFEYRDLFEGVEHVWEVLSLLEAYLIAHTSQENSIRGMVHLGASTS